MIELLKSRLGLKSAPSAASLRYEDVADPSIIEKLDRSGYIDGLYR